MMATLRRILRLPARDSPARMRLPSTYVDPRPARQPGFDQQVADIPQWVLRRVVVAAPSARVDFEQCSITVTTVEIYDLGLIVRWRWVSEVGLMPGIRPFPDGMWPLLDDVGGEYLRYGAHSTGVTGECHYRPTPNSGASVLRLVVSSALWDKQRSSQPVIEISI